MEILTSVKRLYIRFKSLVKEFVYSFGRAALLLLEEVQNHTVPVRERCRIRDNAVYLPLFFAVKHNGITYLDISIHLRSQMIQRESDVVCQHEVLPPRDVTKFLNLQLVDRWINCGVQKQRLHDCPGLNVTRFFISQLHPGKFCVPLLRATLENVKERVRNPEGNALLRVIGSSCSRNRILL